MSVRRNVRRIRRRFTDTAWLLLAVGLLAVSVGAFLVAHLGGKR